MSYFKVKSNLYKLKLGNNNMIDKSTKIVATISDRRCDVEFLTELYRTGVNVMRLNTAHQMPEDAMRVVKNIRKVSSKIAIMIDTKGPEIRTNEMGDERIFKKGETLIVKGDSKKLPTEEILYVSHKGIVKDVSVGKSILIDDGELELKVIKKTLAGLVCRVQNDSKMGGKKSVNVPGVSMKLPSLTAKDKLFVEFSAKNKIDFVAHSFIRNKADILVVQRILDKFKSKTKIIAKIENQEGVDNLDEILDYAYGAMVARGDLGIEVPAEKIPRIQHDMIKRCIERKKPVIVATQMLHTMIDNPRPTRAEVSDIANAVRMGTDAVMLSGETAYGKYPLGAVKVMAKIIREVEKEFDGTIKNLPKTKHDNDIPVFLAQSAVKACSELPIKAIVIDTASGRTAKYLSSFRGDKLIFANCYDDMTARQLSLSRGVYSAKISKTRDRENFIELSLNVLLKRKEYLKSDLVIILAGSFGEGHGASFMEIGTIGNLVKF